MSHFRYFYSFRKIFSLPPFSRKALFIWCQYSMYSVGSRFSWMLSFRILILRLWQITRHYPSSSILMIVSLDAYLIMLDASSLPSTGFLASREAGVPGYPLLGADLNDCIPVCYPGWIFTPFGLLNSSTNHVRYFHALHHFLQLHLLVVYAAQISVYADIFHWFT